MEKKAYTFDEFCSIVKTLRSPEGCPWDREQSHESLKPCLLEEAYEVLDGIETLEKEGNWDSLCEELGDLLLQIVMHSRIAEEEMCIRDRECMEPDSELPVKKQDAVPGVSGV